MLYGLLLMDGLLVSKNSTWWRFQMQVMKKEWRPAGNLKIANESITTGLYGLSYKVAGADRLYFSIGKRCEMF